MGDQINLKWNDFEENVRLAFKDFRTILNDVVLHCGDQKTVANRLVLCACSEVFRSMLLTDEMSRQPYPGILLWDTDLKELEKILDFMYFGEVKVKEDSLTSFLALADRLKVKGLCGKNSQNADEPEQQHQQYQEQKQKFQSKHSYHSHQQQQKQHFQSKHSYQPLQQQPQHISPPSEQHQDERLPVMESTLDPDISVIPHWNAHKKPRLSSPSKQLINQSTDESGPGNYMTDLELLDTNDDIKQEYDIPLEPEQLLIEGQADYYGPGYEGQSRVDTMDDMAGFDLCGNPVLPYQCNFCSKSYKSQGSLQNHRSLYHRDLLRHRETKQANTTI